MTTNPITAAAEALPAVAKVMHDDSAFWFPRTQGSQEEQIRHYVLGLGGEGGEVTDELLTMLVLGLTARIGRVVDSFKKLDRGDPLTEELRARMESEQADVFIYLLLLSRVTGTNLVLAWLRKRDENIARWGNPAAVTVRAVSNTEHDPLDPTDYSADPPSKLATGGIVTAAESVSIGEASPELSGPPVSVPGPPLTNVVTVNPRPAEIIEALRDHSLAVEVRAVADGKTTWYAPPPDSPVLDVGRWKQSWASLGLPENGAVEYVRIVRAEVFTETPTELHLSRIMDRSHELFEAMSESRDVIVEARRRGEVGRPAFQRLVALHAALVEVLEPES